MVLLSICNSLTNIITSAQYALFKRCSKSTWPLNGTISFLESKPEERFLIKVER